LYLPFKYLEMVFALLGDSTMIKSIYTPFRKNFKTDNFYEVVADCPPY